MVDVEAFKAHMKGKAAEPADKPDMEEKEEDTKPEGMTPGHQMLHAIKHNDHAAAEEAMHRVVAKHMASKGSKGGY